MPPAKKVARPPIYMQLREKDYFSSEHSARSAAWCSLELRMKLLPGIALSGTVIAFVEIGTPVDGSLRSA